MQELGLGQDKARNQELGAGRDPTTEPSLPSLPSPEVFIGGKLQTEAELKQNTGPLGQDAGVPSGNVTAGPNAHLKVPHLPLLPRTLDQFLFVCMRREGKEYYHII